MKYPVSYHGHLFRILTAMALVGLWLYFSTNQLSYIKPAVDYNGGNTSSSSTGPVPSFIPGTVMPSMPDEKAKKELGRSTWKYFHTLLARFPDEPTQEERDKLYNFIHLFAELYPCGECSSHFVELIKENPPQTSGRVSAALWGCYVHNLVNERLKKPIYDCNTILEDYDCGCGDTRGKAQQDHNKSNKVTMFKEGRQGG